MAPSAQLMTDRHTQYQAGELQSMASMSLCLKLKPQLVSTPSCTAWPCGSPANLCWLRARSEVPSFWIRNPSSSARRAAVVVASSMLKVEREKVEAGQESVWDYPRPPRLEPVKDIISVKFNDAWIAHSEKAYRVLETSHPPVYYIPKEDINMEYVSQAAGSSFCEWKGSATYWTVSVNGKTLEKVGWSYEQPTSGFLPIQGYLAFYATQMDCYVGAEKAEPQPGGFYGGWVTSNIKGPFKGGPGSWGW